ncbi:hypothetical protein M413DRAFT_76336 [Hebeloma cylindrosporum]|uniref:Uncharacterized protein n=1 Tax=Hebeloma cylindrosporum TaxID=76867 RepID=A0A0C2XKA6_HEBCY|nr:hypothetical protein M413DRAFT_76336 [Hebeloma cylindrosporum h7]
MLAWRAVFRPANIVRRSLQTPRRPICASAPRAHYLHQSRGTGVLAKIRFRADGKPRSRLVGFAFGALVLLNLLTLLTAYDLVEDSEIALGLLASMIYIQRVDMEHDTVDFSDPSATLSYFKRLYQSFTRVPTEEVDDLFADLTRRMKLSGEHNLDAEAHQIMSKAAEKIHSAFQTLNEESISTTANFVLQVMKDALESLITLIEDTEDDDDSDSKYTFQLIRDHSKKDPGTVLKDYEALG